MIHATFCTRSLLTSISRYSYLIQLFYLGKDGSEYKHAYKITDMCSMASRHSFFSSTSPLDERNFQIISIHPVLHSESRVISLVVVTATGTLI
jgi:hypothetical protein